MLPLILLCESFFNNNLKYQFTEYLVDISLQKKIKNYKSDSCQLDLSIRSSTQIGGGGRKHRVTYYTTKKQKSRVSDRSHG